MKGLAFENFNTHPTNQSAFDLCMKLARLDKDRVSPVVLLGESGSGKSHLLWAIVNYYRHNHVRVGIALIAANDFPAKVKDLAVIPDKLAGPTPVVLLVDDLHRFDKDIEDLEKVVFTVHHYKHSLIFATQVHPNVLPRFSGKFKALLNSGAIVGIKPLPQSEPSTSSDVSLQNVFSAKPPIADQEIGSALPAEEAEETTRQLAILKQERDNALQSLEGYRREITQLQEKLTSLEGTVSQAHEQNVLWREKLNAILNRLSEQKLQYESKIHSLESEVDRLLSFAQMLHSQKQDHDSTGAPEEELAKAHRIITEQREEMDRLRITSQKLAEALERQESEVAMVISDIRDTVAQLTKNNEEILAEQPLNSPGVNKGDILQKISDQIQSLEDAQASLEDILSNPS